VGIFELNGTFWLQLINFGIFFAVLNAVFLGPVSAAIVRRRAAIEGLLREINEAAAQVAALRREAEAKRAAARREAAALIAEARAEAEREAAAVSVRQAAEATKRVDAARATVARELAQAREREGQLVRELADGLVRAAIDRKAA
jgi:F-type H+-transporting ATPase subunit b